MDEFDTNTFTDGEITITGDTGQSVTATKGDLFYFLAGSTLTFTTEDFGLPISSTSTARPRPDPLL